MEQNSLRAKLSMTTSELAKIKATEDELYTLKVCVGGILGRELGLGNGQIRNDQIKVSDASSPVLQYPRYITKVIFHLSTKGKNGVQNAICVWELIY